MLELLTGEKSTAQLCREHQRSETFLSRWRQQFLEQGARAFESHKGNTAEQERTAELERMVGRLTMELAAAHVSWRPVPGKKALSWLDSLR